MKVPSLAGCPWFDSRGRIGSMRGAPALNGGDR
jgi:hypothetical protein